MEKPLRSFLFAPASDLRKVDKALSLDADAVILDLEDAVAVSEKVRARSLVLDVLGRMNREGIYVRVNGVNTRWIVGDLMAVVGGRPAGIMLPKAEDAEEVRRVDWLIGQLEREYGLPAGEMELIPLVETARGVMNAYEVATSCPRVKRLAFGAVDYTLDIGISLTGQGTEIFYARSHLVVASRAAGIEGPIDTVYPNIKDEEGLAEECRLVRSLGFAGKLVIHPAQLGPVNEIFSPTPREIDYAAKVAQAFAQAEAEGIAAVQLEGKFIDYPVAAWARRTLAIARALGLAGEKGSEEQRV
ncbi:CoA ester lyase [Desulfofundulus sp. TPOSR]|uniref:Citryl-CoA lyase n=1 Tax=Desulfofundulus kuznetsovii (strain DSM 6115 / VKM B-1805 / 17) TaxID=760568 RepID=A0AAU8PCG4_DESK7|nr:CoA ester lyase [Desulfofundulus sp. TPOSR]AEG14931.1 Citryl-CoA lyase [Desulfofundulus kuznetsovii DSM 6115]NHM25602.1 CoA ester lyase [Desulfofundulus sp. TPOSR]